MTRALRSVSLITTLLLFLGAFTFALAQTADPFVAQITASDRDSFAGDISGDGRLVVIESNGNIATENPDNADGNREIFLFDYAQRRIFQITRTRSTLKPPPTPTPSPTPRPGDPSTIDIEVSNNKPVISNDGRFIAFSSNAPTPASFDGSDAANRAALAADGNQEIFLYQIPALPNADLTSGTDVPLVDLASGTFTSVTNTPASRTPQPGSANVAPFAAFDNRDVAVNDNASIVAFVSTRNLATVNGGTNTDANPEIFVFNRNTGAFAQATNTQGRFVFNENVSLSGDGSVMAFISSGNIPETSGGTGNNADGNVEIYLANFNGTTVTSMRQVTRTAAANSNASVNILSPGNRLSRNGSFLAFESTANLGSDNAIQATTTSFLYNVSANTFTQVGPRPTSGGDVLRFPTFTGDNSTLVFASALNFRADGSAPTSSTDGLNPGTGPNDRRVQIFSTPIASPNNFTRLTNTPTSTNATSFGTAALQPFPTNTLRRIAFSLARTELGGGNADNSTEAFYLLTPPTTSDTPASANAISYLTGATRRDVVATNPTAPAVSSLAPGMLAFARSSQSLAPSERNAESASERRRFPLPVELNGVSVSINSAAAGLRFVSPGEIRFVVPPGLAATTGTNTYPIVINNNGAVIRSTIQITPAQPDIFTLGDGTGNRASVMNQMMMPEPFNVTVVNAAGETVPTVLSILLTGVRNVQASQVTVRIGTTDITGAAIQFVGPTETPGTDQINVQLPASLAGAGDAPIIVNVTISSQTFSSRPVETAPRISIN
ncbi:MAG: PD40 domain-containing protein [Pyrinomonadaceae bacterium]|nr:PD40 domain-containing protein [Pyrinomonadaceae bacterium]